MKKTIKFLSISIFTLLLCACGKDEKTYKCELTNNDVANGYSLTSTYTIYAEGDIVNKVETVEEVTSDNESTLEYFEEYLNSSYELYDETYGGYTFTVKIKDNTVTSKVTIDYNKMDLEKLAKDQSAIKQAMNKDNKLTVDGIKAIYKSYGAVCK